MHYTISTHNPENHCLDIELTVEQLHDTITEIQLPAWRPGRYELQNFAKNVQQFEVKTLEGQALRYTKKTKDCWVVQNPTRQAFVVRLRYYANVINAGSSFVDDTRLYVNFVNCLPYVVGKLHEPCTVTLQIPDSFLIACGMPLIAPRQLQAQDYYELADCPLLASPYLQHDSYETNGHTFHLWFLGNYQPDFERIKYDFSRFSEAQITAFGGDFPVQDYHFQVQVLPTAHYHGVEHRNSTCIVLGPDADAEGLYPDLLGVCSHELYHTWNICQIRPTELLPYDFTKENYFPTGFVAEGVTTYLGDWFLKASGVFSLEEYLKELGVTLRRHFEKDGRAWQSLVESSFDLWLDGYSQAIPHRRVSIYQKGATVALILDLMIRQKHQHARSLHEVMLLMWQRFGKPFVGYSLDDYRQAAEAVYAGPLDWYFDVCIAGNQPLDETLDELLAWVGLSFAADLEGRYTLELLDAQNAELGKWLSMSPSQIH